MNTKTLSPILLILIVGCSGNHISGRPFMGLPCLLDENFDLGADQWEPTDPEAWKVTRDGERSVYALARKSTYKPSVRSPYGISLLKNVVVTDFVLDVWLRSTTRDYGHRDMCIFFGHQDPSHFYYAHFGLKSDDASNTIHIVNGRDRSPIVETRTNGTPWSEGYHHVRVIRKIETGSIKVFFDDMTTPSMTAKDTTFSCGRIGVGSFDDTGNIDRVILWGKSISPEHAR